MTAVIITNPNGIYYGVYSDGGDYTQSDLSNPPTHFAVLDEEPATPGIYNANVYEQGEEVEDMSEIYAETTSVFDVTFTPTAPKRIDDMLHTQPITGLGKVKGYEFEYKKRILNQYRRHNAN